MNQDLQIKTEKIRRWLDDQVDARLREGSGGLPHPFVDPGTGYEDILWDWDAYFSCLGFVSAPEHRQRVARHAKGCVDNFLLHQGKDGHVPYAITPKREVNPENLRSKDSEKNTSKPLLAQFVMLAHENGGADASWLKNVEDGLARSVDHWYENQMTPFGVLVWRSHRGSGADNHPAYFQRPHDSVADPYLNSMMVMELNTLAKIASITNSGRSESWTKKAEELSASIESCLWDPIDGTYYAIDVGKGDPGPVRTPAD